MAETVTCPMRRSDLRLQASQVKTLCDDCHDMDERQLTPSSDESEEAARLPRAILTSTERR